MGLIITDSCRQYQSFLHRSTREPRQHDFSRQITSLKAWSGLCAPYWRTKARPKATIDV